MSSIFQEVINPSESIKSIVFGVQYRSEVLRNNNHICLTGLNKKLKMDTEF